MASNASSSSTSLPSTTSIRRSTETDAEQRPQAEPLPPKIGEIGHATSVGAVQNVAETMVDVPLGPHPAESVRQPSANNSTITLEPQSMPSSHSVHSTKKSILKFLRAERPIPKLKGVRVSTLVRMIVTLLTLTGTVVGWALVIIHLNRDSHNSSSSPSDDSSDPSSDDPQMALSAFVFVHVAFGVGTIFQLLLLERTIFLARAERYNYLNPGARSDPNYVAAGGFRSLAPWNRPPLPTYAAALGFRGTGDVEDNIIAAPPPPAYGNTRGSTLLLSGMLRNSLVERNREDAIEHGSRPVSYMSRSSRADIPVGRAPSRGVSVHEVEEAHEHEHEWSDADRARRVEETLARLEESANERVAQPPPAVLRS